MEKKLYRDEYRKKVGGVCAGLSDYFNVDVAYVRLFFVLACIFHGSGLPIYVVLWIVLPKRAFPYAGPTVDYTVPPQNPGDQTAGGNPFGGNPFPNQPFPNQPFQNQPFPNQPFQPKQSTGSVFAIVAGIILIVIGGTILLDNLNIWPDWEYWRLWPVIPIIVGVALMLSGDKHKKDKNYDWQSAQEVKPEAPIEGDKPAETPAADEEPKA